MKRRLPVAAFGVLVAVLVAVTLIGVQAQTGQTVYVAQAFDVVMAHDGLRTNTYHLAITGPAPYQADLPVSSLASGKITFPLPTGVATVGTYSIIVTAIGDGGSTASDPFALNVISRPAAPAKGVVTVVVH